MIGRTNAGGSGGGGSLNFRIIGGTTAPILPKVNDIWVNTDVKITGYALTPEEPGIKILNGSVATASSHIGADGTIVSKVAYGITGYLEIPEGAKEIIVTCSNVSSTDVYHEFYDKNKNSISRVLRYANVRTYTVPQNAAYVRISRYIVTSNSDSDKITVTIDDGIVQDGAVWITTGTSSVIAFNALKKNSVQVYPISAKQYVNGAWVDVEAKSYQNGGWVDWWDGGLFRNGDQFESITGGWSSNGCVDPGYTVISAIIGQTIRLQASSGKLSIACTEDMVNLSGKEKLVVNLSQRSSGILYVGITKNKTNIYDEDIAVLQANTVGIHELTIPANAGECYVYAGLWTTGDLQVSEIKAV